MWFRLTKSNTKFIPRMNRWSACIAFVRVTFESETHFYSWMEAIWNTYYLKLSVLFKQIYLYNWLSEKKNGIRQENRVYKFLIIRGLLKSILLKKISFQMVNPLYNYNVDFDRTTFRAPFFSRICTCTVVFSQCFWPQIWRTCTNLILIYLTWFQYTTSIWI